MRSSISGLLVRLTAGSLVAAASWLQPAAPHAAAQAADPLVVVVDELVDAGRCTEARALMRHARLTAAGRAGRLAVCDALEGRGDAAVAGIAAALRRPNDPWVATHRGALLAALSRATGADRAEGAQAAGPSAVATIVPTTPAAPVVDAPVVVAAPVAPVVPAPVVAVAPAAAPEPAVLAEGPASSHASPAAPAAGGCPRGTVSVNPYVDWEASRAGACIPVREGLDVPVSVVETNPYRVPESSQPGSRPQRARSNGSADKVRTHAP